VSLCCVWENLGRVLGSEFVLCVGQLLWVCGNEFVLCLVQIGACLEIESVCRVWDSVQRVWGIGFLLCVVEF